MNYTQFKNNNFNVKADKPNQHLLEDLVNNPSLDFSYDGNMLMLGNSMAAVEVLNYNTQALYLITEKDMQDYQEGKTVKLIAQPLPDEE